MAGNRARALTLAVALIPMLRLHAAPAHIGHLSLADKARRLLQGQLSENSGPEPQAILAADSQGPSVNPAHLDHPAEMERQLRAALRKPLSGTRLSVTHGMARLGDYSVGSNEDVSQSVVVLEGDAEVHGKVEGNMVALDGDIIVYPGGSIIGDVLSIGGKVRKLGTGTISGTSQAVKATPEPAGPPLTAWQLMVRHAAGLTGLLATLVVLGFALVTFGRPNLEIVSDTVTHSFARSLTVGMLGQVLILPTLGMLIVGLALTVAGVVLVPFAVAVYALLVVVASLVGLLAVVHAMGERITRRRMARGIAVSPNSYRYVATGLMVVAVLWAVWVVLGWVPVAGTLMLIAAALTTWTVATVGFGAALLSRGGIREHFAGRILPVEMMTDEYLWATPQFGVPAVKKPGKD